MSFFRKIGNIFLKMASKKVEKPAQRLLEPGKIKTEPIRDIEDIVTVSEKTYFSPVQTRNQRKTKINEVKQLSFVPIQKELTTAEKDPIIANEVPLLISQNAPAVTPKVVKEKKTKPKITPKFKPESESEPVLKHSIETDISKKLRAFEVVKPKKVIKLTPKIEARSLTPKIEARSLTPKSEARSIPQAAITKRSPKHVKSKAPVTKIPKKELKQTKPPEQAVETEEAKSPEEDEVFIGRLKGKRKSIEPEQPVEIKLEKWEPSNWVQVLDNIKQMRAKEDAPVDTMGCHKCYDENADEKTKRFQTLVALMLSSQTKDQVTYEAMNRLKEFGCTPEIIARLTPDRLETIIFPVSFFKNKAKYLIKTSKILTEQYNSDIPDNIMNLVKLPGVGPKMAHICMSAAWNVVTGIGVDVHVHRISNRLGWVSTETKDPEQTRKELESWLPSDRWKDVNHLLVGFGQTICTPTKPKCTKCLNNTVCPSAMKVSPKKTLKKEKAA